eukprot:8576542-Pyramimonas_sp.AAC.1
MRSGKRHDCRGVAKRDSAQARHVTPAWRRSQVWTKERWNLIEIRVQSTTGKTLQSQPLCHHLR